MMVFCCARCKTPLMYCHGEVGELDKEEFANLRKKLSRVIEAAVSKDANLTGVADALKEMLAKSDHIAEARSGQFMENPSEPVEREALPVDTSALTDDALMNLQKELEELDAETFLDQL